MKIGFAAALGLLLSVAATAAAQVQVRVGVPGRATYSELHDALELGSPAADSVLRIQRLKNPARLWRIARQSIRGTGDWREGLLAFTRLAELRSKTLCRQRRPAPREDRKRGR